MKTYFGVNTISVFVYDSSFLKLAPSCKIEELGSKFKLHEALHCHGAYFKTDLNAVKLIGFAQKETIWLPY
jgi:hypothetical protein